MEDLRSGVSSWGTAELSAMVTRIVQTGCSGSDVEKRSVRMKRFLKMRPGNFPIAPKLKKLQYECKPCNMDFEVEKEYIMHQNEYSHRKKTAAILNGLVATPMNSKHLDGVRCEVCDKTFRTQGLYKIHAAGLKHRNRAMVTQALTQGDGLSYAPQRMPHSFVRCDLCDVKLLGEKSRKMHENGARHRRNMMKKYGMYNIDVTSSEEHGEETPKPVKTGSGSCSKPVGRRIIDHGS